MNVLQAPTELAGHDLGHEASTEVVESVHRPAASPSQRLLFAQERPLAQLLVHGRGGAGTGQLIQAKALHDGGVVGQKCRRGRRSRPGKSRPARRCGRSLRTAPLLNWRQLQFPIRVTLHLIPVQALAGRSSLVIGPAALLELAPALRTLQQRR